MSILGPNEGPGLYHVAPTLVAGAEQGFLGLGVDQNVLGSSVLAASGTVVVPSAPNDQAYDISVVANATNVCSVTASGRAVTISFIANPNGFSLTPSTSANIETAINASGILKVLTPDGTPSRTFAAGAIGAAQNLAPGIAASGLGSSDVAKQVDTGLATPLGGLDVDVPPMLSNYWLRSGAGIVNPFVTNNVGGANPLAIVDSSHPASRQFLTGTTTTGAACLTFTGVIIFDTTSHTWRYETRFMIPTLSNGTDTVNLTIGFQDTTTAIDGVDGAYVKVDSNTAPNFQCVTSANSVRTTTDSGIALVANTWYRLVIVVTNATSVAFYLHPEGSALPSTPTVTITTNIPTGATRRTQATFLWLKSAGTTSLTCWYAYQLIDMDRLSP